MEPLAAQVGVEVVEGREFEFGELGHTFEPILRVILAAAVIPAPGGTSLLWAAAVAVALYALFVALLVATGRREDARVYARLVPDCLVLARGLLGDSRVPARYKAGLGLLAAYLALPFDLVPDFIPVVGYLDDALLVMLTLRWVVRGVGRTVLREHWRGTARGLELVLRLS